MSEAKHLLGNLPLQYQGGPDFCTVKDATGGDFALTVQPELMQLMERSVAQLASARKALEDARSYVGLDNNPKANRVLQAIADALKDFP